jgi:hypothetical protein
VRAALIAAFAVIAAAFALPSVASATPCWQLVMQDWRDGRIDREYSVQCYRDALANLPEDLRVYGSAERDIKRALTRRLAKQRSSATQPVMSTGSSGAPSEPRTSVTTLPAPTRTVARHRAAGVPTHARTAAAGASELESTGAFPFRLLAVAAVAATALAIALLSHVFASRRRRHD